MLMAYYLVFFSLCDVDGSGFISKKELYDVLKRTCATEDEKIKLKRTSTYMAVGVFYKSNF